VKRYPKYKDSGVPWLGRVPAHWEVKRVKHVFRFRKEINKGMICEDRLALTMSGVVPRALDDAEGLQTEDYSNYQIVEQDNLLFKLIDLQNIKTSRVGHVPSRGIVSPAYIRLVPMTGLEVKYGYWYFMSIYVRDIFNTMGAGVRQSLTQSDLLELPFLMPSRGEAESVAIYLDEETRKIDHAVASQERMIELLKERRSAIITQAVTGQIDVR
jgi:type I restriction enzyme S subunit